MELVKAACMQDGGRGQPPNHHRRSREEEASMNIEKKPAHQIMSETFRYYEGSRILRDLGYEGRGNEWRGPAQQVFGNGPQSFEAAMRDHRAHFRMQQLHFEQLRKSIHRIEERFAESLRPALESFRQFARSPAIQALIVQVEQVRQDEDREEAWLEMAEDHERRALLGEAMDQTVNCEGEARALCELCERPILNTQPLKFAYHNEVVCALHTDCYEILFSELPDGVKGYGLSQSAGRGDPASIEKWEKPGGLRC